MRSKKNYDSFSGATSHALAGNLSAFRYLILLSMNDIGDLGSSCSTNTWRTPALFDFEKIARQSTIPFQTSTIWFLGGGLMSFT